MVFHNCNLIYDGKVQYPASSLTVSNLTQLLEYVQSLRQMVSEAEARAEEAWGYTAGHNLLFHSGAYNAYDEDLNDITTVDMGNSNQTCLVGGEVFTASEVTIDDFEGALHWVSEDISRIALSLDTTDFYQGTQSLAIDWNRVENVSEGIGAYYTIFGPPLPLQVAHHFSFYAKATDRMTIRFLAFDGTHYATSPDIEVDDYWQKVDIKISDFVPDPLFNNNVTRLYVRVADVPNSTTGTGRLNIDYMRVYTGNYVLGNVVESVPATSTNMPVDAGFVQIGTTNEYTFTTTHPAIVKSSLVINVNLSVLGANVVTDDGAGNLVCGIPGVLAAGANSVNYVTGEIDVTFGEAIVAPPPDNPTCTYDYMANECTTLGPATIRIVFTPLVSLAYPAALEVTSGVLGTSTLTRTAWGAPLLASGKNALCWGCQPTAVTTSGWLKATLRLFNAADPGMYVDIPAQDLLWVDDSTLGAWHPFYFVYSSYTSNLNAGTPLDITLVTDIALILEHQFVGTVVFSELSEGKFPQLQFNQKALGAVGAVYALMSTRKKAEPGVNVYTDVAYATGGGTPSFDLLCDKTAANAQENTFNMPDLIERDYVTDGGEAIVRLVATGFARIQGFTLGWRNHP